MKTKNLDVRGTSQDAENTSVKDVERNAAVLPTLIVYALPQPSPVSGRLVLDVSTGLAAASTSLSNKPPTSPKPFVLQNHSAFRWSRT